MWKLALAVPVAMLTIALLELPYGYYTLLRIVVTTACIWLAVQIYDGEISAPVITVCTLAILYNPIVKVSMTREAHSYLNVATALLLVLFGWRYRERLK
jgi:hypothetical protein